MSQPVHPRLRRIRAFLGYPSDNINNNALPRLTDSETPEKVRRMLKILLKNLWDDYINIRQLGQRSLALYKASFFQLVDIRGVSPFEVLGNPPILPYINYLNIATINEIFYNNSKIFLVTKYLKVSFTQLRLYMYNLEKREIATIIAEIPASTQIRRWIIVAGPEGHYIPLIAKAFLQRPL